MQTFFAIAMLLALLSVVAALAIGLLAMAKGGAFNRRWGNKVMRARIILQGAAVALFLLAVAVGRGGG